MMRTMNTIDKLKAMRSKYGKAKRPRHYAEEILQLKSREERLAALQNVPDGMRGMVKTHVEATFEKLKCRRQK